MLTRTRFTSGWAGTVDPADGEAVWDQDFADPNDRERLNLALLAGDVDRLRIELEVIRTWATKTLAHLDPNRLPKYHELRTALDTLGELG